MTSPGHGHDLPGAVEFLPRTPLIPSVKHSVYQLGALRMRDFSVANTLGSQTVVNVNVICISASLSYSTPFRTDMPASRSHTNRIKQLFTRSVGVVSSHNHCPNLALRDSVLLTFDDGPDPTVTPQILDLLDQYCTRAVFFIAASRIHKAPELLPEVLRRGHLLGNHTYTHWLGKPPGFREYKADLQRAQDEIAHHSGVVPALFRPALGQLTIASLMAARSLNLTYTRWSLDSGDWQMRDDQKAREQGHNLSRVVIANDIILMHDDNPHTPTLLKRFLESLPESRDGSSGLVLNPSTTN